jgi:hypothetical protein
MASVSLSIGSSLMNFAAIARSSPFVTVIDGEVNAASKATAPDDAGAARLHRVGVYGLGRIGSHFSDVCE